MVFSFYFGAVFEFKLDRKSNFIIVSATIDIPPYSSMCSRLIADPRPLHARFFATGTHWSTSYNAVGFMPMLVNEQAMPVIDWQSVQLVANRVGDAIEIPRLDDQAISVVYTYFKEQCELHSWFQECSNSRSRG